MKYLKAYETYKADNLVEVRHMLEIMSNFEGNLWTDIAKAKLNALTEVEVVPLSELFDKKTITEIKKRVRPVPKECYSNSFHTAEFLSEFDVEYCEGYIVFMGIPIEHAFNKIGDKYFDVTQELAIGHDVSEQSYGLVGSWDPTTALRWMATGDQCYGGVFDKEFIANHREKIK